MLNIVLLEMHHGTVFQCFYSLIIVMQIVLLRKSSVTPPLNRSPLFLDDSLKLPNGISGINWNIYAVDTDKLQS